VPSDKARAVVDAMERDMGTTLATKQDLERVSLATKQDLERVSLAAKQDLALLRQELRQEIQLLRQEMDGRFALVDQKFDTLELRLTVKLGSMIVAACGLTIAALRLWV
jgi:cytochrome c1